VRGSDEIEAEWSIIRPIEDAWAQLPVPNFPNYSPGSQGTRTADELIGDELRGWHTITTWLGRAA
jgi:glucose-6-phosphate 1-dehydrogenase